MRCFSDDEIMTQKRKTHIQVRISYLNNLKYTQREWTSTSEVLPGESVNSKLIELANAMEMRGWKGRD